MELGVGVFDKLGALLSIRHRPAQGCELNTASDEVVV